MTDQVAGEARPAVNEAAERLRERLTDLVHPYWLNRANEALDEALATERRNTVERIEHRLHEEAQRLRDGAYYYDHRATNAILDEVAS